MNSELLFPIIQEGKTAYIDRTRNIIIKPFNGQGVSFVKVWRRLILIIAQIGHDIEHGYDFIE